MYSYILMFNVYALRPSITSYYIGIVYLFCISKFNYFVQTEQGKTFSLLYGGQSKPLQDIAMW